MTIHTLRRLAPVKALRRLKWLRRTFRGMPSRRVVCRAEREPALRRRLLREYRAALPVCRGGCATDDDVLWCQIAYGFSASEYACYGFADKDCAARASFLSERESVLLSYLLNDLDEMAVFNDKARTYARFGGYYGRDLIAVGSARDAARFSAFVKQHPVFIVKPRFGSCGHGIERMDMAAIGESPGTVFRSLLSSGACVLEEPIAQSRAMAALNRSSVNTVRLITLFDGQRVAVRYCFLKIGRAGSLTDNGAAGGIMAAVDPTTGAVVSDGVDERGCRMAAHPDSGVVLRGFILPDWDRLPALCEALAVQTPLVRMIGWDAAHTESGWVIVEGNAQTELIGVQATLQRGLRAEIMTALQEQGIGTRRFRMKLQ